VILNIDNSLGKYLVGYTAIEFLIHFAVAMIAAALLMSALVYRPPMH